MKIMIFTEVGQHIGFGHAIRCMALYDLINSKGMEVELIVYSPEKNVKILEGKNVKYINWIQSVDFIKALEEDFYAIIDSYLAAEEIYSTITHYAKRCVYIDDEKRINYPEGVIVNPNLLDNSSEYNTKNYVLSGAKYILLRDIFSKDISKNVSKTVQKVLIVMGGTDIHQLTTKILSVLISYNVQLEFLVVTRNEELKNEFKDKYNIKFYETLSAKEIKVLMCDSDMVICGAGQTIFELICLEKPFIPILMAENQNKNLEALIQLGLVEKELRYNDNYLMEKLLQTFMELESYENRKSKIEKAKEIIDGRGTERIVEVLLEGVKNG